MVYSINFYKVSNECFTDKMEDYEEAILVRMYEKRIIGKDIKRLEHIQSMVKWNNLREEYRVKKGFKKVLKGLTPYVAGGKYSWTAASLSKKGVHYVRGMVEEERSKLKLREDYDDLEIRNHG